MFFALMLWSQIKLTSYDFRDLQITDYDNRPGTGRFVTFFPCVYISYMRQPESVCDNIRRCLAGHGRSSVPSPVDNLWPKHYTFLVNYPPLPPRWRCTSAWMTVESSCCRPMLTPVYPLYTSCSLVFVGLQGYFVMFASGFSYNNVLTVKDVIV